MKFHFKTLQGIKNFTEKEANEMKGIDLDQAQRDLVEAIAKNRFHLYRVSHIEEGIEVLTGVSAGKPDKAFRYPKDTVFSKVREKLKKYHELSVRYGK